MKEGLHIIADFYSCVPRTQDYLFDANLMEFHLQKIIETSGLRISDKKFTKFSEEIDHQIGYTGFFSLYESHVSIHTWPELLYVDVDVYGCSIENDNTEKIKYVYESLRSILNPFAVDEQFIIRGKRLNNMERPKI